MPPLTSRSFPVLLRLLGGLILLVAGPRLGAQSAAVLPSAPSNPGSLWPAAAADRPLALATDRLARRVGDLLTIRIRLETAASRQASSATARATGLNDAIGQILFGPRTSATGDRAFDWYRSGGEAPAVRWQSDRSTEGSGELRDDESYSTTLQARVVDVGPSGVLQIEARRHFAVGRDRTEVVLTGFIRPDDLTPANTVDSDRIADLQVRQAASGPIARSREPGLLTRVYDTLNPF